MPADPNPEAASVTFGPNDMPVGLHGTEATYYFMKVGAVTVSPSCYVGEPLVKPAPVSNNKEEESSSNTTIIIAIVVPVVFILLATAVVVWCCYKKISHDREKKGIEVVAVTKTRPSTPPAQSTTKNANEPAVQVHTDEEEIPANQGSNVDDFGK